MPKVINIDLILMKKNADNIIEDIVPQNDFGMVEPAEVWKPVVGYEGLYEVSNMGRVRSTEHLVIGKDGRRRVFPSKIRSLLTYKRYVYVNLYDNQKCERHLVHRLVAEAFVPNPLNRDCVDHINTIRDDNRACNLKWVSHAENHKNPITAQRLKWRIKPVIRLAPDGGIKEYAQINDAEKEGFISACIIKSCKNPGCMHKGYVWLYKDEEIKDYNFYVEEKKRHFAEGNKKRMRPFVAYNESETLEFSCQRKATERGFKGANVDYYIRNGKKHEGYYWRYKK